MSRSAAVDLARHNWVKVEMSSDLTHEIVEDLKYEDTEVIRSLDDHYCFMISDVNLRPIIVVQDRVDRLLGYPEAEFYIERSGRTKYKLDLDPDSYIVTPLAASYSGGKGHIVNVRDGFQPDDYEEENEDSVEFTPEEVLEFISMY